MLAVYIVILLVLVSSGILRTKVQAGPDKSSGSGDKSSGSGDKTGYSRDNDEKYCKQALPRQQAIEAKIKDLAARKQPLPACTCGPLGTVSKIDIVSSGKMTRLVTCSGCQGLHVPVTSSAECTNVPDYFRSDLDILCKIVQSRCKNFTVYRCGSPAVSTTTARTTSLIATTTSTEAPTTTAPSSSPVQTTVTVPPPIIVIVNTALNVQTTSPDNKPTSALYPGYP